MSERPPKLLIGTFIASIGAIALGLGAVFKK